MMKRRVPMEGPQLDGATLPEALWAEKGERPRKYRRQGSRVMSALRSLTNNTSGQTLPDQEQASVRSVSLSPEDRTRQKTNDRGGKLIKRFSLSFLRAPFSQSAAPVGHRQLRKKKPASLRSMEKAANEPLSATDADNPHAPSPTVPGPSPTIVYLANSISTSGTPSTGTSSGPSNDATTTATTVSTAKTSLLDFQLSPRREVSSSVRSISPTVIFRPRPGLRPNLDSILGPIEETPLEQFSPTILTVEKTAAAKIYLETHFNDVLSKPSPRSMRLQYLEAELYNSDGLTSLDKDFRRFKFYKQESRHLRETRVLRSRSLGVLRGLHNKLADNYEILRILGKGSFGVVRLVRERDMIYTGLDGVERKPVYAMKVIRKSTMLKTSQEGHLRAERDFLVSSEGSRWIVPLITSFQDVGNLYLVMEYMPGSDFLGLLIRETVLSEPVARFYIAEMVLCIEEAHALRCIHRDVKPDNFLISASGHLKISDFGLAFDGHWSHDTNYYQTHRYSLVHKLDLAIEGDATDRVQGVQGTLKWAQSIAGGMKKHQYNAPSESPSGASTPGRPQEPLLKWRNRCGNRTAARSAVGTSQYMAPEVICEGDYDARCD